MDSLSAAATRRAGTGLVFVTTCDSNGNDTLAASGDHCRNSTCFSATALWVSGVFNIAANVNLAILIEKRRADAKSRVRAVRLLSPE